MTYGTCAKSPRLSQCALKQCVGGIGVNAAVALIDLLTWIASGYTAKRMRHTSSSTPFSIKKKATKMHIATLLQIACLSAALSACGGNSASTPAAAPKLISQQQLNEKVNNFRVSKGLPAVAVVVIEQDQIELAVSGKRRIDAADSIGINDQFQIGSLTKAVTATLIARLVEKKKLRWDSSLSEVFPAWRDLMRPEWKSVTVQQLLRHRSGLPRDFSETDFLGLQPQLSGNMQLDRATAGLWFLQQPPVFAADSQYAYSNLGYMIVGLMAEAVGGDSYENLLAREVLTPLQMQASFGFPEDAGPGTPAGHVMANGIWQVAQNTPETQLWLAAVAAAGGLNLSVADYGRFLREQLRGLAGKSNFLTQANFNLMHMPVDGYGFGWIIAIAPDLGTVSVHDGSAGSYFGSAALVPHRNVAVAVLCNCASDPSNDLINQFAGSFATLLTKPTAP
ncbi:MAG: serine hydrolase domain-containing protein [Pseudomonadota bacterium]